MAKANIQGYYGAIGVLERMNDTLKVFEAAFPQYLAGFYKFTVERNGKAYIKEFFFMKYIEC